MLLAVAQMFNRTRGVPKAVCAQVQETFWPSALNKYLEDGS